MSRLKEIKPGELVNLIQKNNHLELIDIRTPGEIKRGVIPNAKTLPMKLVPSNVDYFAMSRNQIVIYCRTGSRSAQVCRFLNKQGIFNVINLRGGITQWASGGLKLDSTPGGTIA